MIPPVGDITYQGYDDIVVRLPGTPSGTLPPVSGTLREVNQVLAGMVKLGIPGASDSLVRLNEGLTQVVVKRAGRIDSTHPDWRDCLQEARLGMIEAAGKYEPREALFTTYAVYRMRKYVLRALARSPERPVSVPANAFWESMRDDPNLSDSVLKGVRKAVRGIMMFEPTADQEGMLEEVLDTRDVRTFAEEILSVYPDRRVWYAVRAYYGLGGVERRTLTEVAEELGVSKQRVMAMRDQGLALVRAGLGLGLEEE